MVKKDKNDSSSASLSVTISADVLGTCNKFCLRQSKDSKSQLFTELFRKMVVNQLVAHPVPLLCMYIMMMSSQQLTLS